MIPYGFLNSALPLLFWSSSHKLKPLPIFPISPFISPVSDFNKTQVKEKNKDKWLQMQLVFNWLGKQQWNHGFS